AGRFVATLCGWALYGRAVAADAARRGVDRRPEGLDAAAAAAPSAGADARPGRPTGIGRRIVPAGRGTFASGGRLAGRAGTAPDGAGEGGRSPRRGGNLHEPAARFTGYSQLSGKSGTGPRASNGYDRHIHGPHALILQSIEDGLRGVDEAGESN